MTDEPKRADVLPLGFLLASVGQRSQTAFAARMAARGLNPRAYGVLWALERSPGSQQALSRSLGLPASRMVAVVDDLERRGLVARTADPRDRRAHLVSLTEVGRRTFRELQAEGETLESVLVGDLSPQDRTTLRSLLARVATNLDGEGTGPRIW